MTRIVSAAHLDPVSNHIITCVRHMDSIFWSNYKRLSGEVSPAQEWKQGFVDATGKFLTRKEAWVVAQDAAQILRRVGGDGARLYSENLY